jgi:hypothetical protein
MEIRAAVADDAEAIAALHRAVYPYLVRAPAHFRHSLSTRLPMRGTGSTSRSPMVS